MTNTSVDINCGICKRFITKATLGKPALPLTHMRCMIAKADDEKYKVHEYVHRQIKYTVKQDRWSAYQIVIIPEWDDYMNPTYTKNGAWLHKNVRKFIDYWIDTFHRTYNEQIRRGNTTFKNWCMVCLNHREWKIGCAEGCFFPATTEEKLARGEITCIDEVKQHYVYNKNWDRKAWLVKKNNTEIGCHG